MRQVRVAELKKQLSRYLKLVKLRRDEIVQPARRRGRADLSKEPPVPSRGDAVHAVIDERGDR